MATGLATPPANHDTEDPGPLPLVPWEEVGRVISARIADVAAELDELRARPLTDSSIDEMNRLGRLVQRLSRRVRILAGRDGSVSVAHPLQEIGALLERAAAEVEDPCRERAITVRRLLPVGLPPVRVDGDQLVEAVRSILDNAIEAIGHGGTIEVRARCRPEGLLVQVGNDGPTVPPEIIARAFSSGSARRPLESGSGIGLAIVRRVAELHGGRALMESGPNWTVVTLVLPVENERVPQEARLRPLEIPAELEDATYPLWVFPYPARPLGVALAG